VPKRVEPTAPESLEEAGGSLADQQAMLDRSGAVDTRSEKMIRSGVLTDEDFENVLKHAQRSRAILDSWEAACKAERWDDVVRYIREKNANTGEQERCLDRVTRRKPRVVAEIVPDPAVEARPPEAARLDALFAKAVMYHAGRDPKRLLDALTKLKKLRPQDPAIYFVLGEVYGSAGSTLNFGTARFWFRKFLERTAGKVFDAEAPEAPYTEDDIAASISRLRSSAGNGLPGYRLSAENHLESLKKRRSLLLVTSNTVLDRMVRKVDEELDRGKTFISKTERKIRDGEAYIEKMRGSKHSSRTVHTTAKRRQIQNMQREIKKREARMEVLDVERDRLQAAR
jgi:tetratricopeptide (TPR) repeat protein